MDTNAKLEAELNKAGSSKALIDELKRLIENLEERSKEQNEQVSRPAALGRDGAENEIAQLNVQLENAQAEIVDRAKAHEQDREELELHQEKMKEMELGSSSHIQRSVSDNSLADHPGDISLGDELGTSEELGLGSETKTALVILSVKCILIAQSKDSNTSSAKGDLGLEDQGAGYSSSLCA